MTNGPYLVDGATDLLGGVDEGFEPLLLKPNEVSRAINVTMRGGFPRTRPGFINRPLQFARGEYGAWFISHIFQGYSHYDDFLGMEKIVVSIGGRIFLIDPLNAYLVTDITPRKTTVTTAPFVTGNATTAVAVNVADATYIFGGYPVYINGKEFSLSSQSGATLQLINKEQVAGVVIAAGALVEFLDPNSPNLPISWMEQAEQYLIIQDDQSKPIIFDGSGTRRAKIGTEVPTGSVMAYGRGRLWVATNNGREFVAGDIVGGPTGVLGFTENTFLAGGGSFRIGANVGRIRSMKFVMNLDTSLGQGPLQVLCDRAIYSVNAPTSREAWSSITDPIQTESLIHFGATGHYSTVLVNGDLFFRAPDGLRSFFISRRDFGMWGNTPVSMEMMKTMANDTQELLINSCAALFDNRLLFSAVPQPGATGVRHKCLVALDFDLISTMKEKAPPAYDGIWTGIQVTGILAGRFAGRERCFAFAQDDAGSNLLWEITKEDKFDNNTARIRSRIEYRSMPFQRGGAQSGLKTIRGAETWVSEFAGEVNFTLFYKPDQNPCWQDWATKTICITADQCSEENPCDSTTTMSNMLGFKTRLGFGDPADANNLADEKAMNVGFSFQPALEWIGYAVLNKFIIYAHEEEEWAMAPPSDERSVCSTIQCCPPDPFVYVSGCLPAAPLILESDTTGNGIDITFYAEADTQVTIYHRVGDDFNVLLQIVPTADGYITIETQPTAASGSTEYFWIAYAAAGDCHARTGMEMPFLVI